MLHLRVLIKPDRVIVFETAGTMESEVQRRFKWHLEKNVRSGVRMMEEIDHEDDLGVLSYEHRCVARSISGWTSTDRSALESVLVATANALEEEMAFSRKLVQQLLADLEDNIDRDNLKRLLHYSRRIMGFQSRARYVKRAVDEVLESGERNELVSWAWLNPR
jgi:magnesium transporter